jgi:hypothetical protein
MSCIIYYRQRERKRAREIYEAHNKNVIEAVKAVHELRLQLCLTPDGNRLLLLLSVIAQILLATFGSTRVA